MSNMARRNRVRQLQEEGRAAHENGASRYSSTNCPHWLEGWDAAAAEEREERRVKHMGEDETERENDIDMVMNAILEYVSQPNATATRQLKQRLIAWEEHIIERSQHHGDRDS